MYIIAHVSRAGVLGMNDFCFPRRNGGRKFEKAVICQNWERMGGGGVGYIHTFTGKFLIDCPQDCFQQNHEKCSGCINKYIQCMCITLMSIGNFQGREESMHGPLSLMNA